MTIRDLKLRIRALFAASRVERELGEELSFHIERETQKHIESGLNPADARARAIARFGSAALAADQCRDARGIAFVDGCVRDILYAFRTFRRAPLAALTIVTTVALGLGLVAVGLHVLQRVRVPRRCRAEPRRALRRGAATDVRRGARAFHPSAIRGPAPRNHRLLRRLRRDARYRQPHRRPHDGGHARDRQLPSGAGRHRGARAHPDARRRRAVRTPAGDGAQSPRVVATLRERPGRDRAPPGRQRIPVRDRGRHAEGLSRAQRRFARLLGAALAPGAVPEDPCRQGRRRWHRHRRPAQARAVAASGHGGARGMGFRTSRRKAGRQPAGQHHARTKAGNHSARRRRRCCCSRLSSSPSD